MVTSSEVQLDPDEDEDDEDVWCVSGGGGGSLPTTESVSSLSFRMTTEGDSGHQKSSSSSGSVRLSPRPEIITGAQVNKYKKIELLI